jgi:MFS family permease
MTIDFKIKLAPNPYSLMENQRPTPWYKELSRYHWFVFIVCALGWGLDCFCQQVFSLMRNPALANLMRMDTTNPTVIQYGGYATSILLIGWGCGGILFGVMGDKFGRARTMIFTILFYAIFTGLCGLSQTWWMFFICLFFNGMGVGGQFAAGVTLISETLPAGARPKALGLLQVVAAGCNVLAGSLVMFCGLLLEPWGVFGQIPVWRVLFIVGFFPALLAFVVMRHMEEPQAWKDAIAAGGAKKAGSIPDLFRHPRWRYNVIIGMLLATCGVIGLWGIGFFSIDLTRTTFRNAKNQEARDRGEVEQWDFEFIRMLAHNPGEFLPIAKDKKITPQSLIGTTPKSNEPGEIYQAFLNTSDSANVKGRFPIIFDKEPQQTDRDAFEKLAANITARSKSIGSYVTTWAGIASLLFSLGAMIGTWGITLAAERFGRRIAFTMFFAASFVITVLVFLTMNTPGKVFIMQPMLGFCVLSIFGGYAIYFPELFPTRLRSTAISFCYNIARFAAATGPAGLGLLTAFYGKFPTIDEPIRYAGATMAVMLLFGIIFTWLGPETKGKPLPEE